MRVTTDMAVCTSQDPSDPATYPSHEYLPASDQRFDSVSTRFMQPNNPEYRGLPEI